MSKHATLYLWAVCLVGFFASGLLLFGIICVLGGEVFADSLGGMEAFWILLGCLLVSMLVLYRAARSKNHLYKLLYESID